MARNGRYISKSDFTLLTKKHQETSKGTIFETDYMTISKMDELFSKQKPIYSDGHFLFTERTGQPDKRRHKRYGWDFEGTLSSLTTEKKSTESDIKLRPDYTTLKSFAYYGSATDLINATINGVVRDFPGELYFSDDKIYVDVPSSGDTYSSATYYVISNPFSINTYTKSINNGNVLNSLRYLYPNQEKYEIIYNDGTNTDISSIKLTSAPISCEDKLDSENAKTAYDIEINASDDGSINISVIYKNGQEFLVYSNKDYIGYRIRPKKEFIEKYFNSIDDFTYTLLNRKTLPIYTSKFYTTTFSDEKGFESIKKSYTWPTDAGLYNPLIANAEFDNYLSSLIELASYYDEYESNNIWRSMTHEAIKNLDWTFTSDSRDDIDGDLNPLDTTRIEAICKLYGRLFDDIKLYIDGIKNSNTVTYNGNNNAPDYVLTDMLEAMGWKPKALTLELTGDTKTNKLYPSMNDGYTASDANTEFLRRLILNSAYLLSLKGTRAGIDTLMALFGYDNNEFAINEYVYTDDGTNKSTVDDIIKYNKGKENFYYNKKNGEDIDDLYGIPVNYITYYSGETKTKYAFPWFDKTMKYDGDLYFQCNGGWEKSNNRDINIDGVEKKTISGDFIYNETKPILKYANKLSELAEIDRTTLNNGDICYVSNISDIQTYYNLNTGVTENITGSTSTHYFKLCDKNFSNVIGYNTENNTYGWKMIFTAYAEISGTDEILSKYYEFKLCSDKNGKYLQIDNDQDAMKDFWESGYEVHLILKQDENIIFDGTISDKRYCNIVKLSEFDIEKPISFILYGNFNGSDTTFGYGQFYITYVSDYDKVLYLESIKDDTEGNNPHIGNGKYNNGESYINALKKPFDWAIKNDKFLIENASGASAVTFNLVEQKDNRKCWYFTDDSFYDRDKNEYKLFKKATEGCIECASSEYDNATSEKIYSDDYQGLNGFSEITPYDYEQNKKNTFKEGSVNSVVNAKNVSIILGASSKDEENFINNIVRHYLKEMIPSSSITEITTWIVQLLSSSKIIY